MAAFYHVTWFEYSEVDDCGHTRTHSDVISDTLGHALVSSLSSASVWKISHITPMVPFQEMYEVEFDCLAHAWLSLSSMATDTLHRDNRFSQLTSWLNSCLSVSQAARPAGLSRVNVVRRIVVLKHETSTLRQSHNFISIDFKFGVGDYVREVTSPDKVGSGPTSGRDATWGQPVVFFLILQQSYNPYPWTNIFAHNSSKDAVWCKEDPFRNEKCVVAKFRGVLLLP